MPRQTWPLKLFFLLSLALCGLLSSAPAHAQSPEVIQLFRSDISVAPDASMSVHETIRVRAAGAAIRRGIFRDFPTHYADRFGNQVRVAFNVLRVLRDGRPEPYALESISNGVRVRIGRADVLLSPGEYTYEIFYGTDRQLGFFPDHDELYWNVTGVDWAFPIERAEAHVRLPAGIPRDAVRVEGYTGSAGAKDQNYRATVAEDGTAEFETTRALADHSGLTIVVTWPKGVVTAPTSAEKLHYFFADNRTALVATAGFIVLLGYYLFVWSAVGRDPAPGPVMVRYEPPQGLSPAGMRYLVRMGFDQTTFAAAILSLAVKRVLNIEHGSGSYTLIQLPGAQLEKVSALASEERALAKKIFESEQKVDLSPANYQIVQAATKAARESLRMAEEKIYFFTNSRYVLPGLLISGLALAAVVLSLPGQEAGVSSFMSVWLTGWSVGVFFLSKMVVAAWRGLASDYSKSSMLGAIFITFFALPFWAGAIFGLGVLVKNGSVWLVLLLAVLVTSNVLFHYLLKAPTRAGRALLDQVEGFKQYFLAVESAPMQRLSEPEITPERFENLLPYAIALGVEKAWSARFADALAQAGKSQADFNSPTWYTGDNFSSLGAAGFASALGSTLSNAVASASSSPGSSSGSGGGGSSGGGGGGGGGGGW